MKYTIQYSNGKTWTGNCDNIKEIPVVNCVCLITKQHMRNYVNENHLIFHNLYINEDNKWKQKTNWIKYIKKYNPNSVTKKQKLKPRIKYTRPKLINL